MNMTARGFAMAALVHPSLRFRAEAAIRCVCVRPCADTRAQAFLKKRTRRRAATTNAGRTELGDHDMQQYRRALILGLACSCAPAFAHGDKKDAKTVSLKRNRCHGASVATPMQSSARFRSA